jgi:CheY-like chemotaxis protein
MPHNDATILVVDDDPDTLLLLQTTLGVRGFTTLTASNGREALMRLQETAFDTVLLDLQMPVMGGMETLEHIRANPGTRSIPVLVVSAAPSGGDTIVNALNAGANDYLSKPYNPTELVRRVEVLVDLHRLHRERSRAVREMAGAASHGLSQPVTALLGHLELLLSCEGELSAVAAGHARQAYEAALVVADLVKRIQRVQEHSTIPYVAQERIVDLESQGKGRSGAPFAKEYGAAESRSRKPEGENR